MVRTGGLEPPTSRLSGGRSNQAELQALETLLWLTRAVDLRDLRYG